MYTISRTFVIIMAAILFVVSTAMPARAAVNADDAHKAVVKIKTYIEDNYRNLVLVGYGSGVIINNQGDMLTNYHVIHSEDRFREPLATAYIVCLTTSLTEEPDCSYSAHVIDKNKELDLALLKIRNVEGLSRITQFDYYNRGTHASVKTGDEVLALGYPSIGGKTITASVDTVAGTLEKYQKSWIKTGAVISFGSSGGALVNVSGELIGITSEAHSDYTGSLGYAISMATVEPWLLKAYQKSTSVSPLQGRIDALIREQVGLKNINVFTSTIPYLKMTKPDGWKFFHDDENAIGVENDDPDGGFLSASWAPTELLITPHILEVSANILQKISSLIQQGDMVVSGKTGKRFAKQVSEGELYTALFPSKQYIVTLTWYEGKNKKDKDKIDSMFKTLVLKDDGAPFTEQRYYEHAKPHFTITVPKPWVLKPLNHSGHPASGQNQDIPELGWGVYLVEQTSSVENATNEQYFDSIKNIIASDFTVASLYTPKRYQSSFHYRVNGEVPDGIHYRYRFENEETGNTAEWFGAGYRIREKDRVMVVMFEWYGSDQKKFDDLVAQFEREVLAGLSLGRPVAAPPAATPSSSAAPSPAPSLSQNLQPQSSSAPLSSKKISSSKGRSLLGRIVLQVEKHGEAWYFSVRDTTAYYLGRADDAYAIMRQQGVGVKTVDLSKIPVGLVQMAGEDADKDGLSDLLEDALGTDKAKADTDGDGMGDKQEIEQGSAPTVHGTAKVRTDIAFANKHKGKIFLQVESRGEAWYINPKDGKRYFLGRAADAYSVMRNLGLGISEKDFEKL